MSGMHGNEWFPGYSQEDLALFDRFACASAGEPGFVTDFIGGRTRTSSLWNGAHVHDGQVLGFPVPADLHETVEWVGLLKCILTCTGSLRAMELGAGYAPWIVSAANAARRRGIPDIYLCGVEADPGRFQLMRQHLVDNGMRPEDQSLHMAAVGATAGTARWPRIYDAANAAGGRPVKSEADANYMRGTTDYIDVQIMAIDDLLAEQPVWDFVHIDIQGWEYEVCSAAVGSLTSRVRWLVVGTHSRKLDGDLIDLFHRAGWVLENEKPCMFKFSMETKSLDLMTTIDGAQVWRNPHIQ